MKKLFLTTALCAATMMSSVNHAQDVVKIATEGAYPPWNALNSDGKLEGFEVDLYQDICARAQLTCSIEQTAWDGIIPSLKAGKFDVIMAGMSITDKRKKQITFSRSYASSPAVFVVGKDSELTSFKSDIDKISLAELDESESTALDALKKALDGKTIGAQKGTIHLNFLKEYLADIVDIRSYATQEQLDLDLQSGRVDVAFAAMSYWHPLFQKDEGKDFVAIGPGFSEGTFGEGVGLGLRKEDDELAAKFSVAINEAIDDGTVSKLAIKWFGFDASAASTLVKQKVSLATEGAYPPWNALNSNGELEGFEIDLYKDLCARANLDCNMQQTAWDGIIPSLKAGKFDVIMAGMSITEKRKKQITFSRSYASSPAVFVVDKNSDLASLKFDVEKISLGELDETEDSALTSLKKSFDGKTIGVQKGTIHLNFLKEYMKDAVSIRTYATQEQLDLDLQSGRVDIAFAAMSYWHPLFQKEEGKGFKAIGPGFSEGPFGEGVGLGLRKEDQQLADKFSVAINQSIQDGTVSKLAVKWFGFDASSAAKQVKRQAVRIATEGAYPPWNALNSDGELEGFEIDLSKVLCERAMLDCSMQQTAWDGIIPSLQAGKFDVIMAGMSITDKRMKKISFSRSYASTPAVFVVDKRSDLANFKVEADKISLAELTEEEEKSLKATLTALEGKTIGAQKGTIHLNFLKEYLKGSATIRSYATQEQLDLDLQSGRVDVAFAAMSYWHPLFQKKEGEDFVAVGPGFSEGPFGAGVGLGLRKEDKELADKLSAAINSAISDGTISELSIKWFGFDASTK